MRCDRTRHIVDHCREAIEEIKRETPTGPTWERRWASLMALLRTACEVLRAEAKSWWSTRIAAPNAHKGSKGRGKRKGDAKGEWDPPIFGQFIWNDANLFLHQGIVRAGQSLALDLGTLQRGVYYHMNEGAYKNRDPVEVAEEAVRWLQEQIDGAEKQGTADPQRPSVLAT